MELVFPNVDEIFTLETDASDIGLGACLIQNKQPVGFISRTLTGAEKNYSITEREVLSALWAMKKIQIYTSWKKVYSRN
jgi:hypothetical protein